MLKTERRFCEIRADEDGRRLSGWVIRYDDKAVIRGGIVERFVPGAFGEVGMLDVILNSHHQRTVPLARTGGGGLTLLDSKDGLSFRAELPSTTAADDVLALVRSKVLRGASVEFRALKESHSGEGRLIERAALTAIGIVDKPAYEQSSIEARARGLSAGFIRQFSKPFVSSLIPRKNVLACDCVGGADCDSVSFGDGAFESTLKGDGEVLAITGDFGRVIGSRKRGTLGMEMTDAGLEIRIAKEAATSPAGRELAGAAKVSPMYVRPIVDLEAATFEVKDGVAHYTDAPIRRFLSNRPTALPVGRKP